MLGPMTAGGKLPEAICRFTACQAGGLILEGAPRDEGYLRWPPTPVTFHPGCRAAGVLAGTVFLPAGEALELEEASR